MKDKILALLTAAFAGVRKDGLLQLARTIALQATTEEEAKGIVDKLTKTQVDEFVKDFRADVDKEVSDSNKTYKSNLESKFDLVEKKNPVPGGDGNDVAAMVKEAIANALKPLQTELATYKAGDVAKTRLQSLNEKLATCKDDTFKAQTLKDFARMQFATDDEFNEYLSGKATDIETANQHLADNSLGGQGGAPLFSQKDDSGVSRGVAAFIESQKPDSAQSLGGKTV